MQWWTVIGVMRLLMIVCFGDFSSMLGFLCWPIMCMLLSWTIVCLFFKTFWIVVLAVPNVCVMTLFFPPFLKLKMDSLLFLFLFFHRRLWFWFWEQQRFAVKSRDKTVHFGNSLFFYSTLQIQTLLSRGPKMFLIMTLSHRTNWLPGAGRVQWTCKVYSCYLWLVARNQIGGSEEGGYKFCLL